MDYRTYFVYAPRTDKNMSAAWVGVATLRGTEDVKASSQTDLYDLIDQQMEHYVGPNMLNNMFPEDKF